MGAQIAGDNGKSAESRTGESGRGTYSKSTGDTRTGTTGTAGTVGTAGTAGTSGTEKEEKKSAGLAVVNDDEKREERNAKRRERYAQQKAANGESVKPRKVRQTKNKATAPVNTEQLNALVKTVSAIIASRPDCDHWLLTDKEIDSITTPLAGIIAETEAFAKIANNSNQIALAVACMTVFAPRVFVTATKIKTKKETQKNARKIDETKKGTHGVDRRNDQSNAGHVAADSVDDYSDKLYFGAAVG